MLWGEKSMHFQNGAVRFSTLSLYHAHGTHSINQMGLGSNEEASASNRD